MDNDTKQINKKLENITDADAVATSEVILSIESSIYGVTVGILVNIIKNITELKSTVEKLDVEIRVGK